MTLFVKKIIIRGKTLTEKVNIRLHLNISSVSLYRKLIKSERILNCNIIQPNERFIPKHFANLFYEGDDMYLTKIHVKK